MRRSVVWMAAVLATACGGGLGVDTAMAPGNNPVGPTGGNTAASVSIAEYGFSPQTLSIKAGTAVTWQNDGTMQHTATADAGGWNSGQLMGSSAGGGAYGGMTAGGSYTYTFATAGTYGYHCANHAQMTGTITVTP